MKAVDKIAHPYFLLSVILLILNDWVFKVAFHNTLTGKISDFAGLFAFPFLLGLVFPGHRKTVHILTAILFVCWNSALVNPFISYMNNLGIPMGRTIDFSDNLAMVSIWASYRSINKSFEYKLSLVAQNVILWVSLFAFMATTIPPRESLISLIFLSGTWSPELIWYS